MHFYYSLKQQINRLLHLQNNNHSAHLASSKYFIIPVHSTDKNVHMLYFIFTENH